LKYRNLKNSEALTDLTEVKKGESGYAVAFYREDLADLTVHFEMFSRAVTTTVIQYEKNPSLTVQVRRVDCQATPDLCNDVAGHELPVLAVYPFGLKAKSRPPSIAKMVDATQLMEFVKKDVVPLRLYVLNQENFHQKLIRTGPKAKPWFVLFNAGNWCPPCNQVRPVWKQLARDAMQSTDPGVKKIRIAEIDCDTHKVTCKEMKIDNYPSFVFYQGEVEKSYEGDRDAKSLLDFAANAVDNPVETPSAQQVMQIYQRSQSKPYALLLNAGDWCPPCMEIVAPWKQLAKLLPPNEWLGIGSVNCDQNRWLCQQFEVDGFPTVMILHAPGERKAVMPPTQQKSVELLLNWFRKYYPNL
jgi:thioredoxin-like negative regulator of GroEL